jgi:4-phytase/acid phosphatase
MSFRRPLHFKALISFVIAAVLVSIGAPAFAVQPRTAQPVGDLHLERVVMLMRHGVRSPLGNPVVPPGIAAHRWPQWPVPTGYLTPHGAQGLVLLGKYDRAAFAARGLVAATGCPVDGAVVARADSDQRTIKSAQSWLDGFAPGCAIAVKHKPQGKHDALFKPLGRKVPFDERAAKAAILAQLGPAGLEGVVADNRAALDLFGTVAGCCSRAVCADAGQRAGCTFAGIPSTLNTRKKGARPRLTGPLAIGATAAETILLEYLEGIPMKDVAWGRVSPGDIGVMLSLRPDGKFRVLNRTHYIAARRAALLMKRMLAALQGEGRNGSKVTLLLGHDSNIADVGGMLDIHWTSSSYPTDDVAPDDAVGFELLRDAAGHAFARLFYQGQSMYQLRHLTPLDAANPPDYQYIRLPGCRDAQWDGTCTLPNFVRAIRAKMISP